MQKILIFIFDIFLFQLCIIKVFPPIQYFEEILVILLSVTAFYICIKKYKNKDKDILNNREKKIIIYSLIFFIVGCISTVLYNGHVSFIGILKDILAVFKGFISFVAVFIIFKEFDKERLFSKIVKKTRWYISIIFIFCIINLFYNIGMGHDVRYGIRSYKFLYTHPTYLAFSIVILMCILIANGRATDKKYIIMSCVILASTFRSKAIVFIAAYLLISVYLKVKKEIKFRDLIIIMAGGLLTTGLKIADYFSYGITAARPALYIIGTKLIIDYFPFGSGFCTFGSSLSGEYYSPVYYQYGINLVDGLNVNNYAYMGDSFWPYIYGQFGVIGLVLFALILWNIYKALESRYNYSGYKMKAVNLIFFYLLFASTAEAVFIDVTGQFAFIVLALFLGSNKFGEELVDLNNTDGNKIKLLYISEFFYEVNGAHQLSMMHYKALKEIVGLENMIVVALTGGQLINDDKYINFQSYSSKVEKLRNLLQLNNPRINDKIIEEIEDIIIKENINTVFIDNSIYGNLAELIKTKYKNIKVISFYHDVKRNLYKQWLKQKGIKFLPDYICGIYNEYINQEYCDYNITLNERENKLFKKYYKHDSSLKLPIIVKDTDRFEAAPVDFNRIKILFVGAYYYPNVIGIKWFIEKVMPKIHERYELNVVGKGMEQLRDELQCDRVNIIGGVDSLSEYYWDADIVIAPIFDGAGMKVKTAEAFSYGKVFVGTEESLEGYYENIPDSVLNKYIFKCDSDLEFIKVLNNFNLADIKKYQHPVKEIFDRFYSENAAVSILKKVLNN